MIQKQLASYSSGFFFFAILLACSFFLSIISASNAGTGSGTTKTLRGSPSPTGIAAISLTSQSQEEEHHQQQRKVKNVQKAVEQVKCKTEQGNDVDWFIVYKLPKNRTSSNALVRAGLAYAYILPPQQEATTRSSSTTVTVDISVNENASGKKGSYFGSGGHASDLNNYFPSSGKHTPPLSPNTIEKVTKSATASSTWTLSDKGIDSSGSLVGQSLGKLYVKDNQDIAFLTYNDQPPVGPTIDSGGHSKGIIIASIASGGIWIQHSVPHFPLIDPNNYHYQYPTTGKPNGQVFHCISFSSTKHVDDLAKIFEITKPHVANFSFPTDSFKKALPQLTSIANHHRSHLENQDGKNQFSANNLLINNRFADELTEKHIKGAIEEPSSEPQSQQLSCLNEIDEKACLLNRKLLSNKTAKFIKNEEAPRQVATKSKQNWDLIKLESAGGKTFQAFVKGPSFNEDIYSSWIAPTYKTKLEVQSWLNGPNPFVSNCSLVQYSVFNILGKSIAGHAFSTHNDHSKWAVSLSGTAQPLVCISDLNRMEHQLKRGGVAVCFTDQTIWSTFSSSIIDVQPCPRLLVDGIVTAAPINNNMTLSPSTLKSGFVISTLNSSSKDENQTEDQTVQRERIGGQVYRPPPRMFQRKVKSHYSQSVSRYSLTAI